MDLRASLVADWSENTERRRGVYTSPGTTVDSSEREWYNWGRRQGETLLPLWGGKPDRNPSYFYFAPEGDVDWAVDAWLRGWAEGIQEAVRRWED